MKQNHGAEDTQYLKKKIRSQRCNKKASLTLCWLLWSPVRKGRSCGPTRPVGTDLQEEEATGAAHGATSSCPCGSCDVGNGFEAVGRQGGVPSRGRD